MTTVSFAYLSTDERDTDHQASTDFPLRSEYDLYFYRCAEITMLE